MNNLNSILIEGNIANKPELLSTQKGTHICTFRMVSNRFYRQDNGFEKEQCFFDVETWDLEAELCYAKAKKGRGVRVVGRLKQVRWNNTDGLPMQKIIIVAEHVDFRPEFKKDNAIEITEDCDYENACEEAVA